MDKKTAPHPDRFHEKMQVLQAGVNRLRYFNSACRQFSTFNNISSFCGSIPPAQLQEVQPKPGLPGRDGTFSAMDATVSRADFETIMDDYYQERGWDPISGLLTREGLADLELEDLTAELYEQNLLAE